jgi:hypothetical protein
MRWTGCRIIETKKINDTGATVQRIEILTMMFRRFMTRETQAAKKLMKQNRWQGSDLE